MDKEITQEVINDMNNKSDEEILLEDGLNILYSLNKLEQTDDVKKLCSRISALFEPQAVALRKKDPVIFRSKKLFLNYPDLNENLDNDAKEMKLKMINKINKLTQSAIKEMNNKQFDE